jgi:hypothetical protein
VQFSMAPRRSPLANPVVMLFGLIILAVVAGSIAYFALSGGEDDVLPVVRADNAPVKEAPGEGERGGMDIPHQDSTLFAGMRGEEGGEGEVENLLMLDAPNQVTTMPKEQELEPVPEPEVVAEAPAAKKQVQSLLDDIAEKNTGSAPEAPKPAPAAAAPAEAEAASAYTKPETIHAAGSSPETIAFVKSVLDKKAADTAPAAGEETATPAPTKAPAATSSAAPAAATGTHYVQLASVGSRENAETEWPKLQKKYSAQLAGAGHRVDAADLGERGVFYRIQAGPFSKDVATAKCNAIKAVSSGGCLVVSK